MAVISAGPVRTARISNGRTADLYRACANQGSAEIRGVDLARPIDDDTCAAIERAYDDHAVIFFRDQHIAPPQQVAFTRRFGEIQFNIYGERWNVPGSPDLRGELK